MNEDQKRMLKLQRNKTTLLTIIVVLLILLAGVLLLVWGNSSSWGEHLLAQRFVRDLGSTLLVTVTILTLWELALRRAFLDELLIKIHLSREIAQSGISGIFYESQEIPWETLFKKSKEVDLLLAYGKNWRAANKSYLDHFLQKKSAKLRIVLPNPESGHAIEELAERFSKKTAEELRSKIQIAHDDFISLSTEDDVKGRLRIWRMNIAPVFSMYRFDDVVIISFYSHKKMTGVPHFMAKRGGHIYDFAMTQFETILGGEFNRSVLYYDNKDSNQSTHSITASSGSE